MAARRLAFKSGDGMVSPVSIGETEILTSEEAAMVKVRGMDGKGGDGEEAEVEVGKG